MNQKNILVAIIVLLVGGIIGYALVNNNQTENQTSSYNEESADRVPAGMHRMPDGTMMHNDGTSIGMMDGMDHSMMMVSSEREFITGMIPHHQEAVDTAKEVIARGGTTPEIRELVENIIVAQEIEIADMKQWHQDWYGEPYTDDGSYMPMMRELENLSGAELDRVFLEDMVGHHMGAIMMARSVQPYIEHEEIDELAEAIIASQSAEIAEMRRMLQSL